MKKNKLVTLTLLVCSALLGACSNEWSTTDNPDYAGAGEAIVKVSLQFPQANKPSGYADPETEKPVAPGVALDAEKEIKSIAFFAFTTDKAGMYLSTKPVLDPDGNGFTHALAEAEDKVAGHYTAQFKILSDNFSGKTTLVAIANYAEHGLEPQFKPGITLDELKALVSDALETNESIGFPLLMAQSQEKELNEGVNVVDFVMERIMARVDVVNNAYNPTTTANSFVLTSARFINGTTQGALINGQKVANPTYVDMAPQKTIKVIDPGTGETFSKQQLDPMYVYENSNADAKNPHSKTATFVEVTGTYKGEAYTKVIPFLTAQLPGEGEPTGNEIVPIVRNTCYRVNITPGVESNELEFKITIQDWDKGGDLNVGIDFGEPTLEGLDKIPPTIHGSTWDATSKTLNITAATDEAKIEFTVHGFQDTDFDFEAVYDANTSPLAKAIQVERGEISGYANSRATEVGPLTRTYTVTIPKYTGECPSLTKLVVYNASAVDAATEINVKYAPVFIGDIKSQGATIDPVTRLVDLKKVANGQTGEISFFASANTAFETTIVKKGTTDNFYTVTNQGVDETGIAITNKYGPGKRVTVSYRALTNNPELAEVNVKETGALDAPAKKLYVKCFKKPYFESVAFSPNKDNALVDGTDPNKIYLAVNDGVHGTIDYTVYDDVAKNTFTPVATALYATTATTPSWVQDGIRSATVGENLEVVSDEFQIVKRVIQVSLPIAIKNPASATNLKVGLIGEPDNSISLIPVYPSAYNTDGTSGPITAADKAFAPVCVKGVWWAPLNIGQTKFSAVDDPSTAGGNLFQWGRKRALTWGSLKVDGPVDSAEAAGANFIANSTSPYDWLKVQNNTLWNSGTAAAPKKTINDPCPAGWRVPSVTECNSVAGTQTWAPGGASASANGLLTVTGEAGTNLLFPAAGLRYIDGSVVYQGTRGYYWASAESGTRASYVNFNSATVSVTNDGRANGMPLRCVQDL